MAVTRSCMVPSSNGILGSALFSEIFSLGYRRKAGRGYSVVQSQRRSADLPNSSPGMKLHSDASRRRLLHLTTARDSGPSSRRRRQTRDSGPKTRVTLNDDTPYAFLKCARVSLAAARGVHSNRRIIKLQPLVIRLLMLLVIATNIYRQCALSCYLAPN